MMKHLLLTFIALLFLSTVFGQKTEFRASLNSGLFSYTGGHAFGTTTLIYVEYSKSGYAVEPHGIKSGLCYGISFNFKRISKRNHFWGFDLGYEVLRSKISINQVHVYDLFSIDAHTKFINLNATGQSFTNSSLLNLNPFIGHRYTFRQINFDLTAGADIEYNLKIKEKGKATSSDGTKYTTSVKYDAVPTDVRPRIHLQVGYKKTGLYVGYSKGMSRYVYKGQVIRDKIPSCLIRFGVTYQF